MMRRILCLVALMLLAAAPAAAAHALERAPTPTSADPRPGSRMHRAPDEVRMTFSEPLDPSSNMTVRDECGTRIDDGAVVTNLDEMRVGILDQPSGTYKVEFTAVGLGGVTGATPGDYEFEVHRGLPCGSGEGSGHDHGAPDPGGHEQGSGGDDDHEAHSGEGQAEGGHAEGGHGTDDHTGDDHATNDHADHSDDRHEHDEGDDPGTGPAEDDPGDEGGRDEIAAGPFDSTPEAPAPSTEAVLGALAAATLIGALGGILLRTSIRG